MRGTIVVVAALGVLITGFSLPQAAYSATPTSTRHTTAITRIKLPRHPTVYFFGDSWTHGATADPGRGFPEVVGETLGWKVVLGPDNSGAGYVHTYDPSHALFPAAAAELKPFHADLIVLEGGLNDVPGPLTHFWGSVGKTVKMLRTKSGGAPVIVLGPASPDGRPGPGLTEIDAQEAGAAKQLKVPYISPTKERWFTRANVQWLVDPTTFHPNTAGHAYYAGRLIADLKELTVKRRVRVAS